MSFLRPEAVATVRRYAEPALYAAIAAFFLWRGTAHLAAGSWLGAALLLPGALAALAALGAVERALVARRSAVAGPGVVRVQEGRISYLGPHGGAVVAVDALVRIDIVSDAAASAGGTRWELVDDEGQRLSIPASAADADRLLDVLGGLPGFNNMAVVLAMRDDASGRRPVWRRHAASDARQLR